MGLLDGFPSASGLADANDVRRGLAGLVVRDTSGNPRTGVFPRHANALVTSTATMNSAVDAAEFLVSRSGQGGIFLANDGVTNVLHDAAPVANSRYDIVYVKQNDNVTPNADASNTPAFGILKGTASASPTLPTYATAKAALLAAVGVGQGAEPLTAVLIPSTATTMQSAGVVYTQLYQYTAATGGTVWFRTKADLDWWTTAGPGARAWVLADNRDYVRVGAAWVSPTPLTNIQLDTTNSQAQTITQCGTGKITGNNTLQILEAVVFPVAFASIPRVTVTAVGYRATGAFNESSLAGSTNGASAAGRTPTQFNALLTAQSGTLASSLDYYYDWVAIGVPA